MTRNTMVRTLYAVATLAVIGVTALLGVAHSSWGRPLLGHLPSFAACPVGAAVDRETVEVFRTNVIRAQATNQRADLPDVFGFKLGTTTQAEVEHQLTQHDASCESVLNGAAIQCTHVALDAFPPVDALHLQFDAHERLVALDAQRRSLDAKQTLQNVQARVALLTAIVGQPTATFGSFAARDFEHERYRHALEEFRYSNLFAKVSATRLASAHVLVREQYQLLD